MGRPGSDAGDHRWHLNPPPPEGCGGPDCAVFFKPFSGDANQRPGTGNLFQDNPGTPGMKYILTGWAGAEANALDAATRYSPSTSLMAAVARYRWSVASVCCRRCSSLTAKPFNYKQYMVMAVAPAGTVTVRARASMIDAMSQSGWRRAGVCRRRFHVDLRPRAGDPGPRWFGTRWFDWYPPTEQLSLYRGPRYHRPPAS